MVSLNLNQVIDFKVLRVKATLAEIAFSSVKRVLSEDLLSKKFSAQKVEAGLKVMLYNKFISL
jgi:hypothetical protein